VFSQSLKTNIAIHLAALLLIAMVLIDFVMIIVAQKALLQSEISKGYIFLSGVENNFNAQSTSKKILIDAFYKQTVDSMRKDTRFSSVLMIEADSNEIYSDDARDPFFDELKSLTLLTIQSGKKNERFVGTTWGVFWEQSQGLIISVPLFRDGRVVAWTGVVVSLENVYKHLRQTQYLLFAYIFINTIVLTLIGLYRLTRATVKPLQKLVKRADEYCEDDEIFFRYEKTDNEFGKLSRALNSMLLHLAEDKKKLKDTVVSLEKANLDLKQAQKEIVQAEKLASVGRLSSGVAHEIGNPIGIISGYLELLKQDDIADSDKKEFILRTEKEINRINTIIKQLLDFSKPSRHSLTPISVHEIIEDTVNVFRYQPSMTDIEVVVNLGAKTDLVFADGDQLRQVFLNVMINAADAIVSAKRREQGNITITSEIETKPQTDLSNHMDMLRIDTSDNGVGVEKENLDHLFDPFYTTKEPGKGTGLGLSVSFMIVEGIGGEISVSSHPGEGTTLSILLPVHQGT
jgi:two-component system, NtrC family, sensor kinase